MANRILLTGAGFTHNFGAPLASEVSNLIFNSISNNTQLLDLLRNQWHYLKVMTYSFFCLPVIFSCIL